MLNTICELIKPKFNHNIDSCLRQSFRDFFLIPFECLVAF